MERKPLAGLWGAGLEQASQHRLPQNRQQQLLLRSHCPCPPARQVSQQAGLHAVATRSTGDAILISRFGKTLLNAARSINGRVKCICGRYQFWGQFIQAHPEDTKFFNNFEFATIVVDDDAATLAEDNPTVHGSDVFDG